MFRERLTGCYGEVKGDTLALLTAMPGSFCNRFRFLCLNSSVARYDGNGDQARATIREIARSPVVSMASVARVINARPGVSPQPPEAVLRVRRESGFSSDR